jgi:DNA-binding GntR family transcriptional regulator
VLAGCGNQYLLAAAERLRTISAIYRYWTIEETTRVHRDVAAEHRAICDAAVARDADLCATLVADHIRLTTELMVSAQTATEAASS